MIHINDDLINPVIRQAQHSDRKRKNYNFHQEYDDTLQRMLNAMEPGTYVQPHKHENPDKREAFLILKGSVAVLEFNNDGEIVDYVILKAGTSNLGVEIPEKTFHTLISLERGTVVYEVKDGPYSHIDDKNWAPWAPKEGDKDCAVYLETLKKELRKRLETQ
jgi:cupin fold WbuC family metalloprotein